MSDIQNIGSIITAWQLPHPPIVVPEVGRGREVEIASTLQAMRDAADSISNSGVDTIIIISPHAPSPGRNICINGDGELKGDLGRFGARGASVGFHGGSGIARLIYEEAVQAGVRISIAGELERNAGAGAGAGARARLGAGLSYNKSSGELDHGAVVPLYFVSRALNKIGAAMPQLVVISIAYMDNSALYKFGGCIARAVRKSDVRAALITSGDLSHKLAEDGPYGFDPAGPVFDAYILDCIAKRDVCSLLGTSEIMLENAAQCGFYGLLIVYGALDELGAGQSGGAGADTDAGAGAPCILSYEGTFGVGYAIAKLL